tara:strand:- start:300 stop:704 length:405 start_codon:yes stop_codon:yes gene_type:complete
MQLNEEKIVADFALFNTWEEKYEYLIELGGDISLIQPEKKTPENLIHGCQSQVWLDCEKRDDRLYFYGDSDALISKGLVALIIKLFSGSTALEILNSNNVVFDKIQLNQHLSMTRSNGLVMMIKQIKKYAQKNI